MGDHQYSAASEPSQNDFLGVVDVMLEAAGPSSPATIAGMPRVSKKRPSPPGSAGESESEYKRRRAAELARLHRQKQKCYVESLREQIETLNHIIKERDQSITELNESVKAKDRMIERLTNIVLNKINEIHDKVDNQGAHVHQRVQHEVVTNGTNVITVETTS